MSRAITFLSQLCGEPGVWQLCQLAAFVVFTVWVVRRDGRHGKKIPLLGCFIAFAGAGAVAFLFDPVLRLPALIAGRLTGPLFRGTIVSYGALYGLTGGWLLATRLSSSRETSLAQSLDRLAAPASAAIAISRFGCLLAGCDFGRPTSLPWGVVYGPSSPAFAAQRDAGLVDPSALHALPVHPTQAYEMIAGVGMIAAALAVGRASRTRRPGAVFAVCAATYALARAFIETLRGDSAPALLGVRTAIAWSVITVALSVLLVLSAPPIAGEHARRTA